MAFSDLILKESLELTEGLTAYFIEPTLADSRKLAKLAEKHEMLDYGLLASAIVIDHFEGCHAPTEDEWPALNSEDDIVTRADTLKEMPSRLATKTIKVVRRLLGETPEDQD